MHSNDTMRWYKFPRTCCTPAMVKVALAVAGPHTLQGSALVLGCLKRRPRTHTLAVGSCHALMVLVLLSCCQLHAVLLRLLRCCHALFHLQGTNKCMLRHISSLPSGT